ncbi:hypothetical protein [Varunaivibrio sulfuroxidans]|uniref:Uncharacterized protein n=1 Tax=Varunaivibrio sulfuroxidans TaxID=1773489 RepID=A0A4R3JFI0_9PROT|nr:hypothetical protein [Varunaivibrio sulfuroxidans]TCS64899.1 hypothetical protein EDD55_101230 [Varunaivibrio sulfuroxidans]WES29807.1 hypothetical protein P3M64_09120 [Varunaivibrio sulfuroxidans]
MQVFSRTIVCYAIYRDGDLFEQGRATRAEARGRVARLVHLHPDFEWTTGTSLVPGFTAVSGSSPAPRFVPASRVLH